MLITNQSTEAQPGWLAIVADQVHAMRFGVVQIVVHDSRVVQIERTEKVRVSTAAQGSPGSDPFNSPPDDRRVNKT